MLLGAGDEDEATTADSAGKDDVPQTNFAQEEAVPPPSPVSMEVTLNEEVSKEITTEMAMSEAALTPKTASTKFVEKVLNTGAVSDNLVDALTPSGEDDPFFRIRSLLCQADTLLSKRRAAAKAHGAEIARLNACLAEANSRLAKRDSDAHEAESKLAQQQTEATMLQLICDDERRELRLSLARTEKRLYSALQKKRSLQDLLTKRTAQIAKEAGRADAAVADANRSLKKLRMAYYISGYADGKKGSPPTYLVEDLKKLAEEGSASDRDEEEEEEDDESEDGYDPDSGDEAGDDDSDDGGDGDGPQVGAEGGRLQGSESVKEVPAADSRKEGSAQGEGPVGSAAPTRMVEQMPPGLSRALGRKAELHAVSRKSYYS